MRLLLAITLHLNFPEGVVPRKTDLIRKLTTDYAHKVPDKHEFSKVISTASNSLETGDLINRKDSSSEFNRQFGLLEKGALSKDIFALNLREYGETFYAGKSVRKELDDRYHDLIIKKVRVRAMELREEGKDLDGRDFDDIYKEAAEETLQHLLDFNRADDAKRDAMAAQGVSGDNTNGLKEPNQKGLITPNEAALEQWNIYMDPNASEEVLQKRETFLERWDKRFTRPSPAPEAGVNQSNDASVAPTMEPVETKPEVVTEQPTTETIEWTPEQTSRLIEKVPAKQVKTVSKLLKSKAGANPSKDELVDVAIEGIASNLTGVNQLGGTKADDILAGLSSLGVDVTSEDILSRVREAVAEREQKQYLADYIIGGLANAPEQLVINAYDFAETAVKQFGYHTGLSNIPDLFSEERFNRKVQEAKDKKATFNPKIK